jgi:DNA polymerase-4
MDAFFASVEVLDHPHLAGLPVLVGHDGSRGVVSAASYAARVFGCRSAQPMALAKSLCPHAMVMPVRFARYREVSGKVFEIFERFTPVIEPLSIDEAFLDLTGTHRLHGPPEAVARRIRQMIRAEIGITASVGVAGNKFLAKLASDMNKPDGLTILGEAEIADLLPTLPIENMWGIGPKTAARIKPIGIRTFADIAKLDAEQLAAALGSDGQRIRRLATGQDDRPVVPDADAKSIGQEQTFASDIPDPEELRRVLLSQAEQVAARLRKHALRARAITIKIRDGRFQTITRSTTLPTHTDATADIWSAAKSLFDAWAKENLKPVRLIGCTAKDLIREKAQLELFANPQSDRQRRIDKAVDTINTRFGSRKIHRGGERAREE